MGRRISRNRNLAFTCIILIILCLILAAWCNAKSHGAKYSKTRILGVPLEMVDVNLANSRMDAAIAQGNSGELEGFRSFMRRTHPGTAINGGYFGMDGKPTGDMVIQGKLVARGAHRTGLCILKNGKAVIRTRVKGAPSIWNGCKTVICAGPRLMRNGKIDLNPTQEGFTSRSLQVKALRTGVGITKDQHLILVVTRQEITFREFAEVFKQLGVKDAINFDGGGSTALYYHGKIYNEPVSCISNVLLVYD